MIGMVENRKELEDGTTKTRKNVIKDSIETKGFDPNVTKGH